MKLLELKILIKFYHHLHHQCLKIQALEHIDALGGKPFQAFPAQDHRAHITAHLNFMSTNMVRNNPAVMASIQKNILEHISLMAQEQVQLEFREEMQQMMANDATDGTSRTHKLLNRCNKYLKR